MSDQMTINKLFMIDNCAIKIAILEGECQVRREYWKLSEILINNVLNNYLLTDQYF